MAAETWSLTRRKVVPDTRPMTSIPLCRPPGAMSFPLFVLTVSGEPPLKETVTGEPVFASKMFSRTSADPETGSEDVATIASGVPSPTSEATMKL